jgi:hypothetical protein
MLMLMSKSESANVRLADTVPQAHSIVRYHWRSPPSSIKFGTDLKILLCVVQGVNTVAIVTTLILVRRSNNVCPYPQKFAETIARQ